VIVYLVTTASSAAQIAEYLLGYGSALAGRIKVVPYAALARAAALPAATYIFSCLGAPTAAGRVLLANVCEQLRQAGFPVLNHPSRFLRRGDLLPLLHERGFNRFEVHRATADRWPRRFPVFLRRENDHAGQVSAFLHGQGELEQAVVEWVLLGIDPHEILINEFLDTADRHGVFRKYTAMRIGDRIIPREVLAGRHWQVKSMGLLDPQLLAEQLHYLRTNPHESEVQAIFELAGTEYGHVDYSMVNGRMQIWEVGTNMDLLQLPHWDLPELTPAREYVLSRLEAAFEALDWTPQPSLARAPIHWDLTALRQRIERPATT
jgi:hypothetical protein